MNIKKIVLSTFCIAIFSNSLASTERCPSVDEIKKHEFHYWLPLYVENEELASTAEVQRFQENVTAFVVARWARIYLENGHCFYEGNDPILQKIIFAHDAYRPVESKKWIWTSANNLAECYSTNVHDCGFIE